MRFEKGQHPNPKTEFKKGVHSMPQTEFKKGLIPWHKGKSGVYSKETLEKMRLKKLGKKLSEEHRLKMGLARMGHKVSEETRFKISKSNRGENHWNWMGGKSQEYPLGWNRTFREQIRQRDNYKCQICSCPETECRNKLSVHHIDYNKNNLDIKNLISLCHSCHTKTNSKRVYWLSYFKEKVNV